jgi:hypothetical protein
LTAIEFHFIAGMSLGIEFVPEEVCGANILVIDLLILRIMFIRGDIEE